MYAVWGRMGLDSDWYLLQNNLTQQSATEYIEWASRYWRILEIRDAMVLI